MQQLTASRARTARPQRARINAWVDLAIGGLLSGTGVAAYFEPTAHIALGVATLVGVGVHLALHGRWIVATARRWLHIPWAVRSKALVVLLLLLVCAPLMLSGMVVALIYAPGVAAFHTGSFYLFAALVLLHLALSWRWIAARLRRQG